MSWNHYDHAVNPFLVLHASHTHSIHHMFPSSPCSISIMSNDIINHDYLWRAYLIMAVTEHESQIIHNPSVVYYRLVKHRHLGTFIRNMCQQMQGRHPHFCLQKEMRESNEKANVLYFFLILYLYPPTKMRWRNGAFDNSHNLFFLHGRAFVGKVSQRTCPVTRSKSGKTGRPNVKYTVCFD